MANTPRQPSAGSRRTVRPLAATDPTDMKAVGTALAIPRRLAGNHRVMAFAESGNRPPWARPTANRDHQSVVAEPDRADPSAAVDQSRLSSGNARLAPIRSPSQPPGTCATM